MDAASAGAPSVNFEVDQFELLILREGDQASKLDDETIKRLQADHLKYLFRLQASGKLLGAGAIGVRAPGQKITGIGFFRLGSVAEVQGLINEDPSIKAGLDSAEVLVFLCPKGAFAFPQSIEAGASGRG
ncbi:MAG: YciI family protein [Candidatus Dormibacteraceae bacterium]